MISKFPRLFLLLLVALFFLNFLQSIFTELIHDEAYYWYYAQEMAWGYFDHPPMVALMIKIGSLFFKGELGVRFISCLFSVGTAIALWLMVDNEKKNDHQIHFFLLLFSLPLLNAYGFLTLPDTPLLFFTALFLLVYKNFLEKETPGKAILLGILMATMMYSKYHAALVIIFIFLSNFALAKSKMAWLALLVSLVCYVPHLFWLFEHDFVTLNFHIYERPNQPYNFEGFTLGYLLNLIVVFGLLFPWMYWALFKTKAKDKFTKSLLYLVFGFIVFFFISSFNRRTQAQWVVVICIPMVILGYNFLLNEPRAKRWIYNMGIASVALLFYARFWLVFQPLLPFQFQTHGNKDFMKRLEKIVGTLPVVFENKYDRAAMYQFYTGNTAVSLNNFHYRRNQYSINDSEDLIRNKKVAYISKYYKGKDFTIKYKDSTQFYGAIFEDFKVYRKLECYLSTEEVRANEEITLKVYNPYEFDISTDSLRFYAAYLNAYKQNKKSTLLKVDRSQIEKTLRSKDTISFTIKIPEPKKKNLKYVRFGILEDGIYPGINSYPYKFDGGN